MALRYGAAIERIKDAYDGANARRTALDNQRAE
jgi:hypothetical protein